MPNDQQNKRSTTPVDKGPIYGLMKAVKPSQSYDYPDDDPQGSMQLAFEQLKSQLPYETSAAKLRGMPWLEKQWLGGMDDTFAVTYPTNTIGYNPDLVMRDHQLNVDTLGHELKHVGQNMKRGAIRFLVPNWEKITTPYMQQPDEIEAENYALHRLMKMRDYRLPEKYMPGPMIKKGDPFKVQSLPSPIKGLLELIAPQDDPMGGMSPNPMVNPLISIYKNAAARTAGTKGFLESAKNLGIEGLTRASEEFASRYPRVAAHMRMGMENAPHDAAASIVTPDWVVKEPVETRLSKIGGMLSKDHTQALPYLMHEGTHVAQALGNRYLKPLFKAGQKFGQFTNPFEKSANIREAATRAGQARPTKGEIQPAIKGLKGLIEKAGPEMRQDPDIRNAQKILGMRQEPINISKPSTPPTKKPPLSSKGYSASLEGARARGKLTDPMVRDIRAKFDSGLSVKKIQEKFYPDVSRWTVGSAAQRDSWNFVK